jgi:hypothetical protein
MEEAANGRFNGNLPTPERTHLPWRRTAADHATHPRRSGALSCLTRPPTPRLWPKGQAPTPRDGGGDPLGCDPLG